jgi:Flp pilus assembly protein TadD
MRSAWAMLALVSGLMLSGGVANADDAAAVHDWNAARAASVRIETFGADGSKIQESFGASVGEPPQILVRLTALRGAHKATVHLADGKTLEATGVTSSDRENDLAVLATQGELPPPAQPDLTIRWRFYEEAFVIPGPGDAREPLAEGTTDPVEIDSLRVVPLTGDYPAGLSVMHTCGRWIGITGRIEDGDAKFTYLTPIESIAPLLFGEPSRVPIEEAAKSLGDHLGAGEVKGLVVRGVLQAQKDVNGAMPFFDRALALDRTMPEIHFLMGKVLLRAKRLSEAIASFEEAIRLRPDWTMAYQMAGTTAGQQGKHEQAISFYDEGLKHDAKSTQLLVLRWGALYNLGRYDDALTTAQKALEIDPQHEVALYDLGTTYVHLGRKPEAEEQLRKLEAMGSSYASRLRQDLGGQP